jgi:hypothetical protein
MFDVITCETQIALGRFPGAILAIKGGFPNLIKVYKAEISAKYPRLSLPALIADYFHGT